MEKCPFNEKLKCDKCRLLRRGVRFYEGNPNPVPVEVCVFIHIAECLENQIMRSIGEQKATEQTRNEMMQMNTLFQGLANQKGLKA